MGDKTGLSHAPQVILPKAGPPVAKVWTWVKIYPQTLRRLPGVLPGGRMTGGGVTKRTVPFVTSPRPYVGCRGSCLAAG